MPVAALPPRGIRASTGVFFVGISTTGIYCRPICPARVSYPGAAALLPFGRRRRAGWVPALHALPAGAGAGPGGVRRGSPVARTAALRIAAGALNGRSVAELARELGVSERHLRRSMERELGVGPVELAQTHRLLLAKCLLTDTSLPVTQVAFASGFQSLRRFNSVFQQRYRLSPTALRKQPTGALSPKYGDPPGDWIRLTLAYRPPLPWKALIATLAGDTPPGVGAADGPRYGRTVALGPSRGVIFLEPAKGPRINVDLSVSLLPALMPLLARIRHLLDLDAEPHIIDAQLAEGGLAALVAKRPGLRLPGAFDGFEVAARELLGTELLGLVTRELGEPFDSGIPFLDRLAPSAERVAEAGERFLVEVGVPQRQAEALAALAQATVRRSSPAGARIRCRPCLPRIRGDPRHG